MWNSFFPKKSRQYIFPHYIHILLIHCILFFKKILLLPNITLQNTKDPLHFLHKKFHLRQAKYLATLCTFIAERISNNNLNAACSRVCLGWVVIHNNFQFFLSTRGISLTYLTMVVCISKQTSST